MASATSSAGIWDIWDVCRAGNAEALRRLCTEGADVNLAEFSGSGSLALHFAAQAGSVACCKILLDNGSRADVANAHAWTPLLFASERGHIDVARLLLAHGVSCFRESLPAATSGILLPFLRSCRFLLLSLYILQ